MNARVLRGRKWKKMINRVWADIISERKATGNSHPRRAASAGPIRRRRNEATKIESAFEECAGQGTNKSRLGCRRFCWLAVNRALRKLESGVCAIYTRRARRKEWNIRKEKLSVWISLIIIMIRGWKREPRRFYIFYPHFFRRLFHEFCHAHHSHF